MSESGHSVLGLTNLGRTALVLALTAGVVLSAPGHVHAADSSVEPARRVAEDGSLDRGLDMRIISTPDDVLLRVELGKIGNRFRPQTVRGAMGWSVRLAQSSGGEDATWPTPATDGERVFVGGPLNYSEFYAMRADTGGLAWKAGLTDNGPTPPVVRDRRVYFNTQSCTLYAYDARTGGRKWSRYLAGHLESIPTLDGESIVTTRPTRHEKAANRGGQTPALTVLSLAGRIESDVDIDSEAVGAPVVHDGNAYLATRNGTLYCVDVEKGAERWRRDCKARGAPWVDASGVYVATQETLAAFHPTTGAERWTDVAITPSSRTQHVPTTIRPPPLRRIEADATKTDAFWGEGMRPVVSNDRLCVAEGRTLRFFDRVTGVEEAWWELDVTEPFAGPPLVAGNTLIVATHGGQVRGVDARHGEIIWAVDIDQRLGSGVIVDDGKLYVVTRDGRLVCVQTGDLRADGWPMWGGTPSHAVEAE